MTEKRSIIFIWPITNTLDTQFHLKIRSAE
jgi:hypothetical protein